MSKLEELEELYDLWGDELTDALYEYEKKPTSDNGWYVVGTRSSLAQVKEELDKHKEELEDAKV